MKVVFEDGRPPPTADQLEAVEKKVGIFPPDYKNFLLTHNGGRPEPGTIDFTGVDGLQNSTVVRNFLAVCDGEEDDLLLNYEFYVGNERLPVRVLPIAYDPGGNLICMSLRKQDRGAIYFWDHEFELERPVAKNLALLAGTFSGLLALFHD